MSADGAVAKKKYGSYKQHYRKKWEEIPQLRGWLSMFPNKDPNKTKAFCKYCQRKMVPHVTGLLKHSACGVHIKKAKEYMDRVKEGIRKAEEKARLSGNLPAISSTKTMDDNSKEDSPPKVTVIVPVGEAVEQEAEEQLEDDPLEMEAESDPAEAEGEDEVAVEEEETEEQHSSHSGNVFAGLISDPLTSAPGQQVKIRVVMDDSLMSTHVIDTTIGGPAVNLGVSLYKLQEGRWILLSDSVTDTEGRCHDLLRDERLTAGRFKMHYDVGQYYSIRNRESFFPFIEVVFDVSDPSQRHHVPLLLSHHSYTTYRGS